MYKVITMSIRASKVKRMETDWSEDFLTVPEGYYLGTTAGHRYFGGGEGFAVGKLLHAIVVDDGDFPEPVRPADGAGSALSGPSTCSIATTSLPSGPMDGW